MVKKFDKSFAQLDDLLNKEDWKGIIKLLGSSSSQTDDFFVRYEEALLNNVGQGGEILPFIPPSLIERAAIPIPSSSKYKQPSINLPLATKVSPQRQTLVKAFCKSYTRMADAVKSSVEYKKQMEKWCEELLTLTGRKEDVDGLVGRAEALIAKEEYEEAVRILEKAFEATGRGDRDVGYFFFFPDTFYIDYFS
jgi:DnaJ family protein C protein 3